jgi:methyl acetate hydrolase
MKDTGVSLTPERRARLVGMHSRGEDGALTPMKFEMTQEPEFEMGGGGALRYRGRLPCVRTRFSD